MSAFSLTIKKRYLAIGLLPMIADGALQAVTPYQSDNSIRVVTGLLAGVAVVVFISLMVAMPVEENGSQGAAITSSEDQKTP